MIAGLALSAGLTLGPAGAQPVADDFSGNDLAKHWQVVGAKADGFKVEGGNLLVLAGAFADDEVIAKGGLPNLFTLDTKLPTGDWTMSVRFNADLQTVRESLVFGLMDASDKYVLADIRTGGNGNSGWQLNAEIRKRSGASLRRFTEAIAWQRCNICGKDRTFERFAGSIAMPIDAQIVKTGRQYMLQVKLADADAWTKIATLVSINPPSRPVLFARQWEETDGETAFRIDHFRLEAKN